MATWHSEDRLVALILRAQEVLGKSYEYVKANMVKKDDHWGADKWMDGTPAAGAEGEIGVYGTACAIRTLRLCGESSASDHITRSVHSVCELQVRPHGCWTTASLGRYGIQLVPATCYAINALLDAEAPVHSPEVRTALSWLDLKGRTTQRGWGYYAGDTNNRLIPTCLALLTLARLPDAAQPPGLDEPIGWLRQQHSGGGWGKAPQRPVTPGHTALATLTLLSFEPYRDCAEVKAGLTMLSDTQTNWEVQVEDFSISRTFADHEADYIEDTYHIYTPAIGLLALVKGGVDARSDALLERVEGLVRYHKDGYYFFSQRSRRPTWAIMYGCLALDSFVRYATFAADPVASFSRLEVNLERLSAKMAPLEQLAAQAATVSMSDDFGFLLRATPILRLWAIPGLLALIALLVLIALAANDAIVKSLLPWVSLLLGVASVWLGYIRRPRK